MDAPRIINLNSKGKKKIRITQLDQKYASADNLVTNPFYLCQTAPTSTMSLARASKNLVVILSGSLFG